jgi:uncharacterized protein YcsI (UPF0317 family)
MNRIVKRPDSNCMLAIDEPPLARPIIRTGDSTRQTAGIASENVQDNLCIVPKELALDFAAFCQRNLRPCPLIGLGSPGNPTLPDLGDIDIRTDIRAAATAGGYPAAAYRTRRCRANVPHQH